MADIEVGNLNAKISLDDNEANKTLAALAREVKVAQSEFKRANAEVDGFGKGTDGLRAKADSLTKSITAQQQLVNKLRAEHEKSAREKGEDAKQTQNYEVRLNKAAAELAKLQNELRSTNTELEKQTTAWNKVGTTLDGIANKMESVGRKMSDAGTGMSMAITAPLVAVSGLASKAAIDFESAFAGVRKTVDATEEELAAMNNEIRNMAKEIPAAATEIARVAEAAGQLGIKNAAIMGFTRTMVDLGVATNLSGEQAATALARLANITQMPQSEFDRLGSTIVALGNNLATTEAEIVEMGLRLAGAGSQIGLTEAQILALAGSLSSVGIEAEAGGTAFSRVMIDMANAAATGGKQLDDFGAIAGMSGEQFRQSFQQDAAGAVVAFIEGLGKLSAAGENTFAALETLGLGEIRVRDALLRASGAGDLFRNSLELGTKAWEENNALTKEAEQRYDTSASKLQIFRNKLNDTAITAGNALVPALIAALDASEPIIDAVGRMAEGFAALDVETQQNILKWVALAAAAGPVLIVTGKLVTSIGAVTTAVRALGTALTWLSKHPVVLGLTALTGAVIAVTSAINSGKKATEELRQAQEELQRVQQNGIDRSEIGTYEEKIQKLDELKESYLELVEAARESDAAMAGNNVGALYDAADKLGIKLTDLGEIAREFGIELEFIDESGTLSAVSLGKLESAVQTYTKVIKDASRETAVEISEQARQITMRNQEVVSIENLLKQYRSAKSGTDEWNQAQSELARLFPQYTTEVGINAEAIEGLLIVKREEIAASWASLQVKAQEIIMEKQKELAVREAAIAAVDAGAKWLFGMENAAGATRLAREEVEKLKGEIASLSALAEVDPSKVPAPYVPTVPTVPPNGTNGAYQNKPLDDAYRMLEHKKRLDQLTLEQELKTLEQIKASHIKTAEERMAIEERIHSVKADIRSRDLNEDYRMIDHKKKMGQLSLEDELLALQAIRTVRAKTADEIMAVEERLYDVRQQIAEKSKDRQAELLDLATQKYRNAVEDQLVREDLSAEQRFKLQDKLYNDIIWRNDLYLKRVLADDSYTAEEKAQIQKQITEVIRQNINNRLTLQQDYYESVRQQEIDSINDLSQGVQDALKAKYTAEQKAAEEGLKAQLDANEKWRNASIENTRAVYDHRIRAAQQAADAEIARLNRVLGAQIQAIQDELDAIDAAEKLRSRAELDASDEQKLARLREKLDYEHDEHNKAQLQKEINKVLADQEARHQKEQLDDKKDALKAEQKSLQDKLREETEAVKQQLAEKKEMLQADRDAEIQRINDIAEATKLSMNNVLSAVQTHYAQVLSTKNLQAEAEKLIIDNQQKEIVQLLEDYGDDYQKAGKSLGERLYDGFKVEADRIKSLADELLAKFEAVRQSSISAMVAAASQAAPKPSSSTTTNTKSVTVQNNFNAPVTSPSDVTKAAQKTAQKLALGL